MNAARSQYPSLHDAKHCNDYEAGCLDQKAGTCSCDCAPCHGYPARIAAQQIAAKCVTSSCDKKAEKRIQLPAIIGGKTMDLCVRCYCNVADAVKGCTMAAEQCPACLAIAPEAMPFSPGMTGCGACGCEYGTIVDLARIVRVEGKCPDSCPGYTFAFDVIAETDKKRHHGFACRTCRLVVQWG